MQRSRRLARTRRKLEHNFQRAHESDRYSYRISCRERGHAVATTAQETAGNIERGSSCEISRELRPTSHASARYCVAAKSSARPRQLARVQFGQSGTLPRGNVTYPKTESSGEDRYTSRATWRENVRALSNGSRACYTRLYLRTRILSGGEKRVSGTGYSR